MTFQLEKWVLTLSIFLSFQLVTQRAFAQNFTVGGSAQYFNLLIAWNDLLAKQKSDLRLSFKDLNLQQAFDELKSGKVDIVLVERPVESTSGLLQVPVALSAIAVVYNLPGLNTPLRLKPNALQGLFSGRIKTWNQPEIIETNSQLKSSRVQVLPTFYLQSNGLSDLMMSYFSRVGSRTDAKSVLSMRAGVGFSGPAGVLDFVRQNPGAIGFVDLQQLPTSKLNAAIVLNQANQWSSPETDSVQKAAGQMARVLNGDFRTVVVNPPGLSSYPLSFLVYLGISQRMSLDRRRELLGFLRSGLSAGEPVQQRLGLAPFPLLVRESVERYMARTFVGTVSP